jgi:hypothetical protein
MVQMLVRSQVVEKTKSRQGLGVPLVTGDFIVEERPRSWGWTASAAIWCGRGASLTAHEVSDSQGTGGTRSVVQRAPSQ